MTKQLNKAWFTADLFLGDDELAVKRGFTDYGPMMSAIVNHWNEIVSLDDLVFVLGNVTKYGLVLAEYFFSQVKGKVAVLPGEHDGLWAKEYVDRMKRTKGNSPIMTRSDHVMTADPISVVHLNYDGATVPLVACPWPLHRWPGYAEQNIHLYGGDDRKQYRRSMNVSLDFNSLYPVDLDDIMGVVGTHTNIGMDPPRSYVGNSGRNSYQPTLN